MYVFRKKIKRKKAFQINFLTSCTSHVCAMSFCLQLSAARGLQPHKLLCKLRCLCFQALPQACSQPAAALPGPCSSFPQLHAPHGEEALTPVSPQTPHLCVCAPRCAASARAPCSLCSTKTSPATVYLLLSKPKLEPACLQAVNFLHVYPLEGLFCGFID